MSDIFRISTPPPQSRIMDRQQSSLDLGHNDEVNSVELAHLMCIALHERDADSARFDWLESRATPDAARLWNIFTHKAAALNKALAARRNAGG